MFLGVQPALWGTGCAAEQHEAGTVLLQSYSTATVPFLPPVSSTAACCQELNATGEGMSLKTATDVFHFERAGCGEISLCSSLLAALSLEATQHPAELLQTNQAVPLSTQPSQIAVALKHSISN